MASVLCIRHSFYMLALFNFNLIALQNNNFEGADPGIV
jgi:hypothetical protein